MSDNEGDGRDEINENEEKSQEDNNNNNEASGSDSSAEGGEDIDAYKYDDFVVPEADEGEAAPKKKKKGHKRKHKEIRALDESDLDLIEENTGMRVNRPKGPPPRKFRRLVRGDNDAEVTAEPTLFDDDEIRFDEGSLEEEKPAPAPRPMREPRPVQERPQMRRQSDFDPSDSIDITREDRLRDMIEEEEDDFYSDEDELDDFIVGDMDADGQPVRRRRKKKRMTGDMAGVTAMQMQAARDIFGDDIDESMFLAPLDEEEQVGDEDDQYAAYRKEFEPAVLEERYITRKDEGIKQSDVPERLQLRFPNRPIPEERDLVNEATWIHKFLSLPEGLESEKVVPKIANVLRNLLVNRMEIPFILNYRRDYWVPELEASHLWEIFDLDEKWFYLQSRKESLTLVYQAHEHDPVDDDIRAADRENVIEIEFAQSEEDLNDFHDCFVFHHYDEIVQKGGSKYKRPVKRDAYTLCKKSGIRNFLKHFGITPKEFGSSVESVLKTPVQDDPSDPDEVAERYISADFSSTESVLKAAQFMFVKELTIEPRVRRYFRNRFWLDAVINTDLTSNGKRELNDEFHPLRAVKHVRDKLIVELASSDLYLLITKAKREGLITYDIKLPDWVVQDITQDIEKFFFSDSTSTVARKWNEIRRRIVNDLKDEMSKLLTAQLEEKLKREATQYVAKVCAQQLENMLLKGPYQPPTPKPVDEWDAPAPAEVDADVSVIGFSWGRFEEPTYAAYIDPEGELQAQESFNILSSTRAGDAEATRLAEFIRQHNPTAVVLGTDGYSTRTLFTLIERCMQQLRDEDDSFKPKPITFMDTNIAHIYANSKRAKDEFPGYPAGLLRAISTARRLLDPLPEIAGLCNQDNEIASLQLHQLKELVPKDQLLSRLERPFLAVVNSVGVEINRVVDHKWVEPLLQFVCGLGPRKAQALLQSLRGRVRSRKDLQKVLGSCVYTNCVAFLRIFHTTEENEDGDFLDNMRIHPDDYELAQKIARDAIDAEREGDDNIDYVRKLVDEPAKLDDIDLVMCAQYLEEEFQAKKLETLKRMKEEFHAPFLDCRRPYADPTFEEVFDLLTGESGDSLAVGQIVSVRVLDVGEKGVRVALDNGLTGLIPVSLFTDNRRSLDWNNDWPRIKEEMQGSTIQAKIKEINKERFFVVLTTRASDMQTAEDEAIAREKRAQARKPRFYHRAVAHPFFKNITHEEAIKYLADKEPGEYLIRPSSRGPNYLTITWKFYGGLYANIEVREEGKENAYTLGKKLTIEGRSYEDLNELFITFVDPMAMNANDMVSYNKYKEGDQTTLEQSLREEKQGNPARIPYLIGLNYKNPGSFIIYYIPNNSLRKEPIGLTPEGFKFRDKVFKDPDQLVGWFKRHFNDPIPQKKRPASSSGAPPVAPHNEWDGGYSNNDWDTRATPADRRRTDPRGPRRDNYNRGGDYRSNRRDNDRDDYRSRDAGGSSGWASSSWDRPTYEQPQATASEWD